MIPVLDVVVSASSSCTEHPLAEGFNLTQGHAKVKVPDVSPSNHYFVVCEYQFVSWGCTVLAC